MKHITNPKFIPAVFDGKEIDFKTGQVKPATITPPKMKVINRRIYKVTKRGLEEVSLWNGED